MMASKLPVMSVPSCASSAQPAIPLPVSGFAAKRSGAGGPIPGAGGVLFPLSGATKGCGGGCGIKPCNKTMIMHELLIGMQLS